FSAFVARNGSFPLVTRTLDDLRRSSRLRGCLSPPVGMLEARAVPGRRVWFPLRIRIDDTGNRACPQRLDVQSLEIIDRHRVELGQVEAGEALDPLLRHVCQERVAIPVEPRVANGQKKM